MRLTINPFRFAPFTPDAVPAPSEPLTRIGPQPERPDRSPAPASASDAPHPVASRRGAAPWSGLVCAGVHRAPRAPVMSADEETFARMHLGSQG